MRRLFTFVLVFRELLTEPDVEDALGCFLTLVMCAIMAEFALAVFGKH